ncbi:MAG: DUF1565 domain-containing protein [Deltaproteobacteria bacterium]|nr:DUF1565 domain-containing protein [Deltaproteobacteria bacterium]
MMQKKYLFKLLSFLWISLLLQACVFEDTFYFGGSEEPIVILVPEDFSTIQEAMDFAIPGDLVSVADGIYSPSTNGEVFPIFLQDGVDLFGESPQGTILDAEGSDGVLDIFQYDGYIRDLTITGGEAIFAGGILIEESSPLIENIFIIQNQAIEQASALMILNSNNVEIVNTVIAENFRFSEEGFFPAQVEIENSNVFFNNNVVSRGDADGLRIDTQSEGEFQNNIFFQNGIDIGVGLIDESPKSLATIQYNLFFDNLEADFFISGDFFSVEEVNDLFVNDEVEFNFTANPLFVDPENFNYHLQNGSPAIEAGNPSPEFRNPDGTRNDIGVFGGPRSLE